MAMSRVEKTLRQFSRQWGNWSVREIKLTIEWYQTAKSSLGFEFSDYHLEEAVKYAILAAHRANESMNERGN